MEQVFAQEVSKELNINIYHVVREEWELKILQKLADCAFGKDLIFKGGTALRLAYNSPRFSEDLDFSLKQDIATHGFKQVIKKAADAFDEVTISDLHSKRFTHLAELKIREDYLPLAFSVKVEISRRITPLRCELKLITSPTTNLQVLINVQTLEQIKAEKEAAIKSRAQPRDFFDLWFINQITRKQAQIPKPPFPKAKFKQELHKYLPPKLWKAIEEIYR